MIPLRILNHQRLKRRGRKGEKGKRMKERKREIELEERNKKEILKGRAFLKKHELDDEKM